MKKGNGNYKLISGLLVGLLLGGLTVVGANQAIQAIQNTEIKVSLNGQLQQFKDETTGETQYPITYHNRTYLPLRNVASLAGLEVGYNNDSNTAILEEDVIKEIITKAEKQLCVTDSIDEEYGRKKVKVYVRGIELADNDYIKTLTDSKINGRGDYKYASNNFLEHGHISYEGAYNYLIDNPKSKIPINGNITFMIEYDKDFEGAWAGNGPAYYTGRYAIGSLMFKYEDGVLSFGTGGSKEYEEYDIVKTEESIGNIINKIDNSTDKKEIFYLLTSNGEVYRSCIEKSDKNNVVPQYTKLKNIPDMVTGLKLEFNGGLVICELKNGETVYFKDIDGEYSGIHKYYSFLDGGYPFENYKENGKDIFIYFLDDNKLFIVDGLGNSNTYRINGNYIVSEKIVICKLNSCTLQDGRRISMDGVLTLKYNEDHWKFQVLDWEYNTSNEVPSYADAYFYEDFIKTGDEFLGATV